ncbi:MAG: transposase, partial [Desulfobulbaceae bacterium]|nr:transposase [Desulfobulbaceae bacterium]
MLTFLRTVTGIEDGAIGAVMTIHTFGDYCRWNCHIHGIVADGLFYGSGMFYVMPKNVDLDNLAALFRANVLKMLKKEGKIDDSLIKNIMGWRHMSGFSVHNGVRIGRDDEDGKEGVAQYIIRNPFPEAKLTYREDTGMVVYKSGMTHGKDKRNFLVMDAEEFIALITQHIPEKSHQLVRYYGFYSNRARGERRKEAERKTNLDSTATPDEVEVIDVSSYKPRRLPSKTWRDCTPRAFASRHIKKVWEVDPLECPHCHAEMKIISFISKSQPKVIRKILEHL